MAPDDYWHKSNRWQKVIKTIEEQIAVIYVEIDVLIDAAPVLARQKGLLVSIDGIGNRIAINMTAVNGASHASRMHISYAVLPALRPTGTSTVHLYGQNPRYPSVLARP